MYHLQTIINNYVESIQIKPLNSVICYMNWNKYGAWVKGVQSLVLKQETDWGEKNNLN